MKITAYTSQGCFYCDQLKELFRRFDIKYTSIQIGTDISREEFTEKFPSAHSYPHVVIDGNEVGGLTETAKLLIDKGIVSSNRNV